MKTLDHKLNTQRWDMRTNRHPTTGGRSWGWIENHPQHLCWSDDANDHRKDAITSKEAADLVIQHNQWLDDSRPKELKLLDAQAQLDAHTTQRDKAQKEADHHDSKCKALLKHIEELNKLEY